jgi:hypothetical protein
MASRVRKREILDADIPLTESPGTNHLSFANESESQRLHRLAIWIIMHDGVLTVVTDI